MSLPESFCKRSLHVNSRKSMSWGTLLNIVTKALNCKVEVLVNINFTALNVYKSYYELLPERWRFDEIMQPLGQHDIGKKLTLPFLLTLQYILRYENIQEFSSDGLNSTLCDAAFQNDQHLYFIWAHACVRPPRTPIPQLAYIHL